MYSIPDLLTLRPQIRITEEFGSYALRLPGVRLDKLLAARTVAEDKGELAVEACNFAVTSEGRCEN